MPIHWVTRVRDTAKENAASDLTACGHMNVSYRIGFRGRKAAVWWRRRLYAPLPSTPHTRTESSQVDRSPPQHRDPQFPITQLRAAHTTVPHTSQSPWLPTSASRATFILLLLRVNVPYSALDGGAEGLTDLEGQGTYLPIQPAVSSPPPHCRPTPPTYPPAHLIHPASPGSGPRVQ